MTIKLLVRLNPLPGESLVGYIVRLADCNGCESPAEFLTLLPDSTNYYLRKNMILAQLNYPPVELFYRLAELVQKDPQVIFNLTLFPFEKRELSTPEQRNYSLAYPSIYKFCVFCLKEKSYHRKIWDIIILTTCPIHKCLLNYNCSRCKKPLKASQGIICECKCGFDLRETQPTFVSESELKLAKHIYILAGIWKNKNIPIQTSNPLINYSLKDLCQIVYYYTKRVFRLNSKEPFRFTKLIIQENLHELVCKAASIFDNFPKNYLAYIEELVRNPNYMKSKNWFSYFAANYNDYQETVPYSLSTLLYKSFDKNIDDILFRNNRKVSQANLPTLVSHSGLAEQLGIKIEDVTEILFSTEIKLFGHKTKTTGNLYLIEG
ncbi:MAG: TniQ family protein, partial [Bacteroidetes bacterium]|nr:TniQ family protein [Bacteroidota bacterium]